MMIKYYEKLNDNSKCVRCKTCNKEMLFSNFARHNHIHHPENVQMTENKLNCKTCGNHIGKNHWRKHLESKKHIKFLNPIPNEKYCDICKKNIKRTYWKKHEITKKHRNMRKIFFDALDESAFITGKEKQLKVRPKLLLKAFEECRKHNNNECECPRLKKNIKCRVESYSIENEWGFKDLVEFMGSLKHAVLGVFNKWLKNEKNEILVNINVVCVYKRQEERETKYLHTKNYAFFKYSNFDEIYNEKFTENVLVEHDRLKIAKSQWVLDEIINMEININKYNPLRASSYIELPEILRNKKAIINIENKNDNKCFLWSVLAGLYPVKQNPERITKYKEYEHIFDKVLEGIEFPVKIQDIGKFENRVKNCSLNVYHYDESYNICPLKITKDEKKKHIDLLYLTEENGNSHYLSLIHI